MRRIIRTAVWAGALGWMLMPTPPGAAPHRTTVLQGLDKVTARVSTIDASIGATVRFGTLEIIARHCDKRPPEETPEVAVFLEIDEERHGEDGRLALFSGWMFASSPALSALEHPVYDVWVIDCSTDDVDSDLPESLKSANPDNSPDNSPDSASDRRE